MRKQKIPFRISGGLAVNAYGSKRKLYDIDIDVPDNALKRLLPSFKKFKVNGPKHYRDKEWDVNYLSINYKGQDVDLIGSNSQRIFNKNTLFWENLRISFTNIPKKNIFGLFVPIIPKNKLIEYKSKIKRSVDIIDIKELTK